MSAEYDFWCEQCGEYIKKNESYYKTCFNHYIHEDCLDDYMDDLKRDFEYVEGKEEDKDD